MTLCPDADTFQAMVARRLPSARRAEVVEHADECEACRVLLVELIRSAPPIKETLPDLGDPATAATVDSGSRRRGGFVELQPGDRIDRYIIEGTLGAGGMGVVYAARDPELDRRVALKLLHARVVKDPSASNAEARLLREAQAVAKISHPNVIAVHDIGTAGDDTRVAGQAFVAMELVDGWTLREWLAEQPRTWREILAPFLAALRGLAAAHAAGLIHRDIKPDNILIGRDGRVRVTDFGMARAIEDTKSIDAAPVTSSLQILLTQTGTTLGTPAYMAPEQHAVAATDARTDQFSFCVAMWEAMYDERPFAGDDIAAIARAVRTGALRPPPPGSSVPGWIRRALTRGLRTRADERWPTTDALANALTPRRTLWLAIGGGVLCAAVIAGLIVVPRMTGGGNALLCRGADSRLIGIWDATRAQQLSAAFAASKLPAAAPAWRRLQPMLDRFATRWAAMHTDACEDTRVRGDQTEALLGLRMQCLDRKLAGVRTLVNALGTPDDVTVTAAVQVAEHATRVDECDNSAVLLAPTVAPPDAEVAAEVAALRIDLEAAEVGWQIRQHSDVTAQLRRMDERSRAIGFAPLEAEVRILIAKVQSHDSDERGADETLRGAIERAEAGQHDHAKARAEILRVHVLGVLGRFEDAHQRATYAGAVIARLGGDDELEAQLAEVLGELLGREHRWDEAHAALAKALAIETRLFGARSAAVGTTLADLAGVLSDQGKYDEAFATMRQATDVFAEIYGEQPKAAEVALMGKAGEALMAGDFAASAAMERQRVVLLERLIGADSVDVAYARSSLGMSLEYSGRLEEARAMRRTTLVIFARDPTPRMTEELTSIGAVELELGRDADAIETFQHAVTLAKAFPDDPYGELATAQAGLGRGLVRTGRPREAIPYLEASLAWREHHADVSAARLGAPRWFLAQALWQSGGPKLRSRALARQAQADFERSVADMRDQPGPFQVGFKRSTALLADVKAWRVTH